MGLKLTSQGGDSPCAETGWTCIFSKAVFSAQDLKFLVISSSLSESHSKSFLITADVEGYNTLGVKCWALGGRRKRVALCSSAPELMADFPEAPVAVSCYRNNALEQAHGRV